MSETARSRKEYDESFHSEKGKKIEKRIFFLDFITLHSSLSVFIV